MGATLENSSLFRHCCNVRSMLFSTSTNNSDVEVKNVNEKTETVYLVAIGVTAVTCLELYALSQGMNGTVLSLVVAAIFGFIALMVGKRLDKEPPLAQQIFGWQSRKF